MIHLLIQAATANPEALITAAIAANTAAQSAYQAFIISIVILVVMIVIAFMMGLVAIKFNELESNTNSMKDALIIATRKLALVEGAAIGKHEQESEDKADRAAAAAAAAAAKEKPIYDP